MTNEIMTKTRELKKQGYYVVTSIKEKETGIVGTASLVDEDEVLVRMADNEDDDEEIFADLETFSTEYEIIEIVVDDGKNTWYLNPAEFMSATF